ncbi:MAG TPA: DUF1501 domain-containing protein [Hyphomicrobiales bacterium]|nr:DUF1501 domain-containing protein [Hyphomicrobiales bacterium]
MASTGTAPRLPAVTRRGLLLGAGSAVAWAGIPRFARAAGRDPRLVVVVLRGALDGLAAVPPVGDRDYPALRTDLAIGLGGGGATRLDGFFALNDAMPATLGLYRARQALIVHAAATPYRQRSHFDGQDVLENGTTSPGGSASGWLNRAVAALPVAARVGRHEGLAVGATTPLILRGKAPTLSWTPPSFRPVGEDTRERLASLYSHTSPRLAKVFAEAEDLGRIAAADDPEKAGHGAVAAFSAPAEGMARLLAADDGPRVAAISYEGWDTHVKEGADKGRLARYLGALDAAFRAMKDGLGPAWNDTVVVAVTEFGRTAHENGSGGTDHGTATVAFLLGGAVAGGRMVAKWPGLSSARLYQDRDLAPTTDLRAVLKGVLHDHLGLSDRALAEQVFPDSASVRPLDGLLQA